MGACTAKGVACDGPHELNPRRTEQRKSSSKRERLAKLASAGLPRARTPGPGPQVNSVRFLVDIIGPQAVTSNPDLSNSDFSNPDLSDPWAPEDDPEGMESIHSSFDAAKLVGPEAEAEPELKTTSRSKTREEPEGELEPEKEPEREPSADSLSSPSVGSKCPGEEPTPDFSGSWVCSRVEGDWDSFLREAGVAWTLRKVISGLGYGVGRQLQDVSQTEEHISVKNVVNSFPPRESLSVYRLNGLPEEVLDLEGQPTRSVTYWDDGVLVTEQQKAGSLEPMPTVRRFMQGEEMCTVRVSPNGLEVKRFYARR